MCSLTIECVLLLVEKEFDGPEEDEKAKETYYRGKRDLQRDLL